METPMGNRSVQQPQTRVAETLRRFSGFLVDIPPASLATLGVLSVVEEGPQPALVLLRALGPLAPYLTEYGIAVNVPLLHEMVAEGVLDTYNDRVGEGQRTRLYMLTALGKRQLGDLRRLLRDAGQRALALAAADLDTLFLQVAPLTTHPESA